MFWGSAGRNSKRQHNLKGISKETICHSPFFWEKVSSPSIFQKQCCEHMGGSQKMTIVEIMGCHQLIPEMQALVFFLYESQHCSKE